MKILYNHNKKDINKNDRMIIIFFLGLLGGIIFANLFHNLYMSEVDIVSDYFQNKLLNSTIEYGALLKYVLIKRFKYLLILWLLCITILGVPAVIFYLSYCGFLAGFILSISTMKYGLMGIFLVISYSFPHGIIYIPVLIVSLIRANDMCKRMYYNKGGQFNRKSIVLEYLFTIIVLSLLTFIGCLLETYINSNLLQSVLKLF